MGCCCSKKYLPQEDSRTVEEGGKSPGLQVASVIGKKTGAPTSACSKDVLRKKVETASKTGVLPLRDCGLKRLPDDATAEGALAELRTADLANNRITALPPSIRVWSQLQTLNVSDNLLEQLPATIATMVHLKKLILSKNRLSILPEALGELNLTELKCDGNMLLGLPDAFSGALALTLEELDVSDNRLQNLPESVCSLRMITRVLCQQNRLAALPLRGGPNDGLSRLQYINAADNSIVGIMTETLQLPALSELWLKGNPTDRLVLQNTPGFEEFAERRKQRLDQRVETRVVGQVDLTMCGL